MKQKIQAAVFDVDGTLYDYKTHSIPQSTAEAIESLRAQGVRIVIASGRSSALLGKQVIQTVRPDYYVLANGHEMLDKNGAPLRLVRFTAEQTERIAGIARALGIHMMLKFHRINYIYSGWEEMLAVFGEIGLAPSAFRYCPEGDYHRREQPLGVTLKGTDDLREQLAGLGDDLCVEYFHDPSECDVFHKGINKLTGDGTLYDYKTHSIPQSTAEAIESLRAQGVRIVIASGRSSALLGKQVIQTVRPDYYVLANGHEMLDKNGAPLRLVRFTAEQTERIAGIARALGIHMMLKFHRINYIYSGWEEMLAVFGEIGLAPSAFRYCPEGDYHRREQPLGVTLKGTDDLREQLAGLGDDLCVEYFHDPSECDVFHKGINKLTGLQEVLRYEGIPVKTCIAFGDGGNDRELLRTVGCGVAMGNACKAAKDAAKYVCASSWEDGIAEFLHRMALI